LVGAESQVFNFGIHLVGAIFQLLRFLALTIDPASIKVCTNAQIPEDSNGMRRESGTRQQLSNFKADFFKALAHPLRISILDALREGELTVNEISQKFSVEPPNASQQLAVLRNKNIIVARKEGANVYYSVGDPTLFKLLDVAREIFNNHLIGVRGMLEAINLERPGKTARH
jgi:DNA-binding transcriptional ArsR family regulator